MYNNFKMTKEARAMRISIKFIIYDIYTNIPYFFQINRFLKIQYNTKCNKNTIKKNKKVYLKLPFIGFFLNATKIKLKFFFDKYCKNINIVAAFSLLL